MRSPIGAALPDDASWAAAIALSRVSRSLKQVRLPSNLTLKQLTALSVLRERGSMSISELSSAEGLSVATMSRTVAGLVDAGLVRPSGDGNDRRSVLVSTTAKGRSLLQRGANRSREHLVSAFSELQPELLQALRDVVNAILESRAKDA